MENRYLFICNWEINRSPTAASVARDIARSKGLEIETSFMALFPEESSEQDKIDKKRIESSAKVFVMTYDMKDLIKRRYGVCSDNLVCLEIEDEYDCRGIAGPQMTRMLEEILREKLKEYI